ncbi:MAG: hypothetical protein R3B64_02445 [Candidatus Paceibacterota bacterium]
MDKNKIRIKTFVEWTIPDVVQHTTITEEVENRDIENLELSSRSFRFKFFDVISTIVDIDGEKVELRSEKRNYSPDIYYNGELLTPEELRAKFPEQEAVARGAEKENCKILHYIAGRDRFQFFPEGAVFLKRKTSVVATT